MEVTSFPNNFPPLKFSLLKNLNHRHTSIPWALPHVKMKADFLTASSNEQLQRSFQFNMEKMTWKSNRITPYERPASSPPEVQQCAWQLWRTALGRLGKSNECQDRRRRPWAHQASTSMAVFREKRMLDKILSVCASKSKAEFRSSIKIDKFQFILVFLQVTLAGTYLTDLPKCCAEFNPYHRPGYLYLCHFPIPMIQLKNFYRL